jgi:hypothetical protein
MRRFGSEAVGLHMAMSAGSDVLVQLDRHQKMSHSDDGSGGDLGSAFVSSISAAIVQNHTTNL